MTKSTKFHYIKLLMILICSMLLVSCDPGLINNYVIENNSEFPVMVNFKLIDQQLSIDIPDSIQTLLIKPDSKIEFVDYGEIGNAHDKELDFLEAFEFLSLIINGIDRTDKIKERINWEYKVLQKGLNKLDEVQYELLITNEDLIKIKR